MTEDYVGVSDYDKEQAIKEIWKFLDTEDSKCCFCDTVEGALIRLHQGWCCAKCFKEIVLKTEQEGCKWLPYTYKSVDDFMIKHPQIVPDFLRKINASEYLEATVFHSMTAGMIAKVLKEKRVEWFIIVRRKKVRK